MPDKTSEAGSGTGEPILRVDLGPPLGTVSFATVDDLRKWINDEQTWWQWVNEAVGPGLKPLREILTRELTRQSEIDSAFHEIAQRPDDANHVKSHAARIGDFLRERYVDRKALHSSSTEARLAHSQTDRVVGAGAMLGFLGIELAAPQALVPRLQEGLWLAFAYKHGVAGSTQAALAFSELMGRMQSEQDNLRQTASSLADQFRKLNSESRDASNAQQATFAQDNQQRTTNFDSLMKRSEERLDALARTVRDELALQTPVEYFEKKANNHRLLAIIFAAASVLTAIGIGTALWFVVRPYLSPVVPGSAAAVTTSTWQSHVVEIALILFMTSLGIWILRILIRLTLGNIHLQTDLKIRGMLVKAYLALLTSDKALKDDDRELVLRILFRPTSDGIVRDDAAPITPAELLSRALAK